MSPICVPAVSSPFGDCTCGDGFVSSLTSAPAVHHHFDDVDHVVGVEIVSGSVEIVLERSLRCVLDE